MASLSQTGEIAALARIFILAGYELGFAVDPSAGESPVTLDIEYEQPRSGPGRLLGRLLARPYSAWCLRSIIDGTSRALGASQAAVVR